MTHKKELLAAAAIFMILLLLVSGAMNLHRTTEELKYYKDQVKDLEAKVKVIDGAYLDKTVEYELTKIKLDKQVALTDSLLKKEKEKIVLIRKKLKAIVVTPWEEYDSTQHDTLKQVYTEYEKGQAVIDTLTERKISELEIICELKEEQIASCDSAYKGIKLLLEESFRNTEILEAKIELYGKEVKRKRIENKLIRGTISVGIILAGGYFLYKGIIIK